MTDLLLLSIMKHLGDSSVARWQWYTWLIKKERKNCTFSLLWCLQHRYASV